MVPIDHWIPCIIKQVTGKGDRFAGRSLGTRDKKRDPLRQEIT